MGKARLLAQVVAQSGHSVHGRWHSSVLQGESVGMCCWRWYKGKGLRVEAQPWGQGRHWDEGFCLFVCFFNKLLNWSVPDRKIRSIELMNAHKVNTPSRSRKGTF